MKVKKNIKKISAQPQHYVKKIEAEAKKNWFPMKRKTCKLNDITKIGNLKQA